MGGVHTLQVLIGESDRLLYAGPFACRLADRSFLSLLSRPFRVALPPSGCITTCRRAAGDSSNNSAAGTIVLFSCGRSVMLPISVICNVMT